MLSSVIDTSLKFFANASVLLGAKFVGLQYTRLISILNRVGSGVITFSSGFSDDIQFHF